MATTANQAARGAGRDSGGPVQVWRSMLEVHAALIAELAEALRVEHHLSVSEFDVLINLDGRQPIRHGELSERVILSRTALTRLVDRLLARDLVCRVADPADQRAVRIGLTPTGRRLRADSARTNRSVVEAFFAPLDADSLAALEAAADILRQRNPADSHPRKDPPDDHPQGDRRLRRRRVRRADVSADTSRDPRPVIGILVGSTRPVRIGRQLADRIAELARVRSEADVTLLDLAEVKLPWLDEPQMPARGDYVHEHTREWKRVIDGLDAVIVVSAQYNGGYPAPLKNAIDTLYAEWHDKPILLVTYGFHGGTSAADQLTTVFGVVKANLLPARIAITATHADRDASGHLSNPGDLVERHRAEFEEGFAAIHVALGG